MRPIRSIARQESFLRQDLHEFQNRGVLRGFPPPPQGFTDLPYCAGAPAPENGEDFKFGIRRMNCFGFARRAANPLLETADLTSRARPK